MSQMAKEDLRLTEKHRIKFNETINMELYTKI